MQRLEFFHSVREYLFQGSSVIRMKNEVLSPGSPAFDLFFFHLQWIKSKDII